MIKKIVLTILVVVVLLPIIGFVYFLNQISAAPSKDKEELRFVVEKGEGVKTIGANLKQVKLINSEWVFQGLVLLKGYRSSLKAGDYILAKNLKMSDLVNILAGGALPDEYVVAIKEGWNTRNIAEYLSQIYASADSVRANAFKEEFVKVAETADTRKIIPDKNYEFFSGKPGTQGLEGFLFPDTYRIYRNAEIPKIIEKMLDNFDWKLSSDFRTEIASQGKTVYEVVTMASILEKEVRSYNDKKIAAGIFYRRIVLGMPLQSDATLNYITGKNDIQPSLEDTKRDSLYNTYLNKGLPPGPICNPSLESIKAAIYPQASDYLYFLTKPDGSTVFSKTYEEHLANKYKYLK